MTKGAPGSKIVVGSIVYGPFAAAPTPGAVPANAPVFARFEGSAAKTITLDHSGAGSVQFTTKNTSVNGFYVWVEFSNLTGANLSATSTFGRAAETTLVQTPTLASSVSKANAMVGQQISDTVTVSGLTTMSNPVNSLTRSGEISLLGPVDPGVGNTDCSKITSSQWNVLTPLRTWSFNPTVNQVYTGLGKHTVTARGCYTYTAWLKGINAAGETVYFVEHKPGVSGYVNQTSFVDTPSGINSQVAAEIVVVGDTATLKDFITLTGREDLEQTLIGARVYGPFISAPDEQAKPGPAPVDASMLYTVIDPIKVAVKDGIAEVTLTMDIPAHVGYYVWQEYAASAVTDDKTKPIMSTGDPLMTEPEQATDPDTNEPLWIVPPSQGVDPATGELLWITPPVQEKDPETGELLWIVAPEQATDPLTGEPLWIVAPLDPDDPGVPQMTEGEPLMSEGVPQMTDGEPLMTVPVQATDPNTGELLWISGTQVQLTDDDGNLMWEPKTVDEMQSVFGRPSEIMLITEPARVSSATSTQRAMIGDVITDTIMITGVEQILAFNKDTRVELYGELWGPVPPKTDSCSQVDWIDAPVAKSYRVNVTTDGPLTDLGSQTIVASGCYAWVAVLSAYNGSDRLWRVDHRPGSDGFENQTSIVNKPTMKTQVSVSVANIGTAVVDTIMVAGFSQDHVPPGTKIVASVHGPLMVEPGQTCESITTKVWETAIAADNNLLLAADIQVIEVTGNGDYDTEPVVFRRPGCYTWIEKLYLDGSDKPEVVTSPGEVTETTLVNGPRIGTQTSHQISGVGTLITDSIVVDDLDREVPAVMEAILYGPYTTPAIEVFDQDPNSNDSDEKTRNEDVNDGSNQIREPGTTSIDDEGGDSGYNEDGQTVDEVPDDDPDVIHDWPDMTPEEVTNIGCEWINAEMWNQAITNDWISYSEPQLIKVNGSGTYQGGPVLVDRPGCYTWVEHLYIGKNLDKPDLTVSTPPGLTTETTLILEPSVGTVAQASDNYAGASLVDHINVTGMQNQTGVITGSILGPMAPVPGAPANWPCEGIDWSNAATLADFSPVRISGSGLYKTEPIATKSHGCYTFTEVLTPDNRDIPAVVTPAGLPSETVLLQQKKTMSLFVFTSGVVIETDKWFPLTLGIVTLLGMAIVVRSRKTPRLAQGQYSDRFTYQPRRAGTVVRKTVVTPRRVAVARRVSRN